MLCVHTSGWIYKYKLSGLATAYTNLNVGTFTIQELLYCSTLQLPTYATTSHRNSYYYASHWNADNYSNPLNVVTLKQQTPYANMHMSPYCIV